VAARPAPESASGRNRSPASASTWRAWPDAWQEALYGPAGFYRLPDGPAAHFRTGVHASPLLADALARLAERSGLHRVVDVGAGRGELLVQLADRACGLELVGVDVVPRPVGLPDRCGWLVAPGGAVLPDAERLTAACQGALVVAHEWLDVVPCPVLEVDDDGVLRVVEVDRAGAERLGLPADQALAAQDLAWVDRWWPASGASGTRVEVGRFRDEAWAALVRCAPGAVLVAVDYEHRRGARPSAGTLAGYADGRARPPVPDGDSDLTAHVALDAVADAGRRAGAVGTLLTSQRAALQALGVEARRPAVSEAARDPHGYLAALQRAGAAAELLDPGGLGGFGWLLQSTGPELPKLPGPGPGRFSDAHGG
jgi:SAM-dependent MidA family methyltransferase